MTGLKWNPRTRRIRVEFMSAFLRLMARFLDNFQTTKLKFLVNGLSIATILTGYPVTGGPNFVTDIF